MADDDEDMIGHNSVNATETGEILRMQIEKIERLEEEKQGIADDIKDVFAFLKASGFDVKTVKKVVALRKIERQKREEQEALLETYLAALGMI